MTTDEHHIQISDFGAMLPPIIPRRESIRQAMLPKQQADHTSRTDAMSANICIICQRPADVFLKLQFHLPFLCDINVCQSCFHFELEPCYSCMKDLEKAIKLILQKDKNVPTDIFTAFHSERIPIYSRMRSFLALIHTHFWNDSLPLETRITWQKKMLNLIAHHSFDRKRRSCDPCSRLGKFRQCLICNIAKCRNCSQQEQCQTCNRNFCYSCLSKCYDCGKKTCKIDISVCTTCPRAFCRDCCDFLKCDRCCDYMCHECQDTAKEMPKNQTNMGIYSISQLGMVYCQKCWVVVEKNPETVKNTRKTAKKENLIKREIGYQKGKEILSVNEKKSLRRNLVNEFNAVDIFTCTTL